MPVTAKRARELALLLPETSSAPHFDRLAFRTPRRIFATLARSGTDMNFMFDLATQARFCEAAPHALAPVDGGWGRMGATRCDLKKIDLATFRAALGAAHLRASAKKPRPPAGAVTAAGPGSAEAPKPSKRRTRAASRQ